MRQDVQDFLRDKIQQALNECTEPQRALFARLFGGEPKSVKENKLETALSLCERTLIKNAKALADIPSAPREPVAPNSPAEAAVSHPAGDHSTGEKS